MTGPTRYDVVQHRGKYRYAVRDRHTDQLTYQTDSAEGAAKIASHLEAIDEVWRGIKAAVAGKPGDRL